MDCDCDCDCDCDDGGGRGGGDDDLLDCRDGAQAWACHGRNCWSCCVPHAVCAFPLPFPFPFPLFFRPGLCAAQTPATKKQQATANCWRAGHESMHNQTTLHTHAHTHTSTSTTQKKKKKKKKKRPNLEGTRNGVILAPWIDVFFRCLLFAFAALFFLLCL